MKYSMAKDWKQNERAVQEFQCFQQILITEYVFIINKLEKVFELYVLVGILGISKLYSVKWRILSRTSTEQSGKNGKKNFTYWASSSPRGHVLSLKTFCRNPVLS